MTRDYFLNNITNWDELLAMCQDYDCSVCEDVITSDELDECVDSDVSHTDYGWRYLLDLLADIITDYDFYLRQGSFDYVGLDDRDFEEYKGEVLDWMDGNGLWDDEDDEDEEDDLDEPEPEEPAEPPVEEEDFSVSDLMSMCSAELVTIRQFVEQRKAELSEDVPFDLLF